MSDTPAADDVDQTQVEPESTQVEPDQTQTQVEAEDGSDDDTAPRKRLRATSRSPNRRKKRTKVTEEQEGDEDDAEEEEKSDAGAPVMDEDEDDSDDGDFDPNQPDADDEADGDADGDEEDDDADGADEGDDAEGADDGAARKDRGRSRFIEDEAEVSGEDEEDGEEADEMNEEDKKFIADDEDDGGVVMRRKRRTKRNRHEDELVEEDYDLIEQNTGKRIQRRIDNERDVGADKRLEKRSRLKRKKVKESSMALEEVEDLGGLSEEDDLGEENEFGAIKSDEEPDAEDDFVVDDIGGAYGGLEEQSRDLSNLFGDLTAFNRADSAGADLLAAAGLHQEDLEDGPAQERRRRPAVKSKQAQMEEAIRDADTPERLFQRAQHRHPSHQRQSFDTVEEQTRERERLQKLILAEATWIFDHELRYRYPSAIIPTVERVLRLLRLESMEVPYIVLYRTDVFVNPMKSDESLVPDDVWVIDEWDQLWDVMSTRRCKLQQALERVAPMDYELSNLLAQARYNHELNDIQDHIRRLLVAKKRRQLTQEGADRPAQRDQAPANVDTGAGPSESSAPRTPAGQLSSSDRAGSADESGKKEPVDPDFDPNNPDAGMDEEEMLEEEAPEARDYMDVDSDYDEDVAEKAKASVTFKRRGHITRSVSAVESAMDRLLSVLVLTPRQFSENMTYMSHQHMPPQTPNGIDEYIDACISDELPDRQQVILAARARAARELAQSPLIRSWMKNTYLQRGVIETRPLAKAVHEVDWLHEYADVRRIQCKPVNDVIKQGTEQAMKFGLAEKEGFISYHIFMLDTIPKFLDKTSNVKVEDGDEEEGTVADDPYERNSRLDALVAEVTYLYCSPVSTNQSAMVDPIRQTILYEAFRKYLYPLAERQAKQEIHELGMTYVSHCASRSLTQLAMKGPVAYPASVAEAVRRQRQRTKERVERQKLEDKKKRKKKKKKRVDDDDDDEEQDVYDAFEAVSVYGRKVLGVVLGESNGPATVVLLNDYGEVVDHMELHFFLSRARPDQKAEYNRKKADVEKMKRFVEKYQPTFVALCADSTRVSQFEAELRKSVLPTQDVLIGNIDPRVPRLYTVSERSANEFPEYGSALRMAISTARFALSPISEVCACWVFNHTTNSNELLALDLHPLQRSVPQDMLLFHMRSALVQCVNAVGVDINEMLTRPFLRSTLQFVCGLGPIKAESVIRMVRKEGTLLSRAWLLREQVMGPVVHRNCAGFVRVRSPLRRLGLYGPEREDEAISVLDNSRIHPDNYPTAYDIVISALDVPEEKYQDADKDFDVSEEPSKSALEPYVRDLMLPENYSHLESLAIEQFCKTSSQRISLLPVMKQIRAELFEPFRDPRGPFEPPTPEELLYLMTGETPLSLHEGRLLHVPVTGISRSGLWVRLESGIEGLVSIRDVSAQMHLDDLDRMTDEDKKSWLQSRAPIGTVVTARIRGLKLEPDRFMVFLTCKSTDLKNRQLEHRPELDDPYLRQGMTSDDERILAEERKLTISKRRRFHDRPIVHPFFQNISSKDAEALLRTKPIGEAVFRPSTRGYDYLSVTWKIVNDEANGCIHMSITEKDKPDNNPKGLGRTLLLDGKPYDDLDHIYSGFIQPTASNAQALQNSKYFFYGNNEDIDSLLRTDKAEQPERIPYKLFYVGSSFHVAWLPNESVNTLKVSVGPKGFKLQGKWYPRVSKLIAAFKTSMQAAMRKHAEKRSYGIPHHHPSRPVPGSHYDDRDRRDSHRYSDRHHRDRRSRSRSRSRSRDRHRSHRRDYRRDSHRGHD